MDEIRGDVLGTSEVALQNTYQLIKNPVGNTIEISVGSELVVENVMVEILNVSGQLLISEEILNPSNRIQLFHALQSGFYFLNIRDVNGTHSIKFLVE